MLREIDQLKASLSCEMNMKSNLYYSAKYTVTGAMVDKVDQSDYRKIAKHNQESWLVANQQLIKVTWSTKFNIDSKRFSGKQNVSSDNVYLIELWIQIINTQETIIQERHLLSQAMEFDSVIISSS